MAKGGVLNAPMGFWYAHRVTTFGIALTLTDLPSRLRALAWYTDDLCCKSSRERGGEVHSVDVWGLSPKRVRTHARVQPAQLSGVFLWTTDNLVCLLRKISGGRGTAQCWWGWQDPIYPGRSHRISFQGYLLSDAACTLLKWWASLLLSSVSREAVRVGKTKRTQS